MQHQMEVELKWALDAEAHRRLGEHLSEFLGAPADLRQENRFFDSADLRLRRQRMNLRLRRENGRLLLTCKRKPTDGKTGGEIEKSGKSEKNNRDGDGKNNKDTALHRHDEWECWIEPELFDRDPAMLAAVLPIPQVIRDALAEAPLIAIGGFDNHRLEYHDPALTTTSLCLDRTTFPGRIDYELEIETADARGANHRWRAQLAEWAIPFAPQPLTKFARFLALISETSHQSL